MAGGERSIKIRFDGSAAGLASAAAKARAELKAVQKQAEENKKNFDRFASGALRATRRLARFAAILSTLGGGLAAIGSLTAAIASMSGVLGLLPAAAFAAAGALAAVKLGADGIKAAFEGLTPTLDVLKGQVSAAFERSLTPAVNNLAVVLPRLSAGLSGIATQMGRAATSFTAMLATRPASAQLQQILAATATVIHNIGRALAPVGAAFIRIGAVATPMLAGLTSGIGGVAERFNAFVQQAAGDGRLQQWIQSGIDAFKALGRIVGNAFGILHDVISGLMSSGLGGLQGALGGVLAAVHQFTSSAAGQQAIRAIGDALGQVAVAVRTVLSAGLQAIGPAIPPLAAAFGQLAQTAAAVLKPAIAWLAPFLQATATFIKNNTSWLIPLAGSVLAIAAAFKVWKVASKLLNLVLKANPFLLIASVIIGLVAIIIANWSTISAFFTSLWNSVKAIFHSVIDWITNAFGTVVNWFKGVWGSITGFFTGLWNGIVSIVGSVVNWITSAFGNVVNWFISVWSGITGFFSGLWNGIVGIVRGVINWIVGAWNGAVNGIRGFFSSLGDFIGGIWDGIVSGVKNAINGAIWAINKIIGGVNTVTGVVGIPAIPSIPYLAKGGTAHAGRSYLVGEEGPELFTPGVTGRVTSNEQLSGAPTEVHVYIGDQELKDLVRVEITESHRDVRRRVMAGQGGAR